MQVKKKTCAAHPVRSSKPSVMPSTSESRYRKSKGFCACTGKTVLRSKVLVKQS